MSQLEMYLDFRGELDRMWVPTILNKGRRITIQAEGDEVGLLCVDNGYIDCLYIKPPYRKKGYGRKAVLDYVKKYGVPDSLHIIKNNEVTQKFWSSIFKLRACRVNETDILYEIIGTNLEDYKK